MSNFKDSISIDLIPDPRQLIPLSSPRATPNHETRKNPKYFPNYFKTVKKHRVSLELVNL